MTMTLAEMAEKRNFGSPEDTDWERVDDFSPATGVTPTVEQESNFNDRRPEEVAKARERVEQAYLGVRDDLDEDIY